jgi:Flp pilus assembly protein TadB
MVGIPVSSLVSAGLIFLAVALGTVSLALFLEWAQERSRARKVIDQLKSFDQTLSEGGVPGLFRGAAARSELLQSIAARTPAFVDLELLIQQSGAKWTMEVFLLTSIGLSAALGISTLMLTRLWAAALAAAVVGALLPYMRVRRLRTTRLNGFEALLPEAIDLLGRAIRAGHPLSSGLKMVADETQEPIAGEFRRAFEEQRFGLPFEDAILAMADRVILVDVRILVTAILIQREVGGNLAEVLKNTVDTMRERAQTRRHVRALSAEGRLSGFIIVGLPIVLGAWLTFSKPEYMSPLFTTPIGMMLVAGGAGLIVVGAFWIRALIKVEA